MKNKKQSANKPLAKEVLMTANPNAIMKLKTSLGIIIAVFSFLLYAQSITYTYTLDDGSVINGNMLTKQGLKAIPMMLKTDYWYGNEAGVRGAVYRPVSLILFAIEWQFFPDNPYVGHLINVLLFSLTCWLLFQLLCLLFEKQNLLFPFICSLLYAAHPIHTEVVDNIKSGDEILCFLFGISSILFLIKHINDQKKSGLILFGIFYFLSLLSKENGMVFLVIIPLVLFAFTDNNLRKITSFTLILVAITALYLFIRWQVLKIIPESIAIEHPLDIFNNSLIGAPDFITQKATEFYILLRYVLLLIFPHPLTSDYSFAQIPIKSFGDIMVLASVIFYLFIGIYAVINLRNKSILAFTILFYLITLAPVSNIFILIGSSMAERFMYMPSLGFCIALTFLLIRITKVETVKSKFKTVQELVMTNSFLFSIVFIIAGLYSIKTIENKKE